jgi:hypothetical protein
MKVTSIGVKALIFDVLKFSNEVDEKGQRIPRASFVKAHYMGIAKAKAKIVSAYDIIQMDQKTGKEISRKAYDESTDEEKSAPHREELTEREITFDAKEKEAIKFYFEAADEYADCGPEALEELEKALE